MEASPVTDETRSLVDQAQAGDETAFEALYRAHAGAVYALCLRMSADPARAEELTQDVFIRAWTNLASFRGDAAFGTWLHRVAVNVVLQRRRSDKRRFARIETRRELPETAAGPAGGGPTDRLDLERAVATLPEGAKTVFLLHDVHGYRHREIAEMMGTAEGTAKAQLHRARKLLREVLNR